MKKIILLATSYPYTAGIIAVMWLGTFVLLKLDATIPPSPVLFINAVVTIVIAAVGFRR